MTKAIVSAAISVVAKLVVILKQAIRVETLIEAFASPLAVSAIASQFLGWLVGHFS